MPSLLAIRDLLVVRDPLADAKLTLSSWDNCMAKAYCKWPVIAAIIIGSLIVISVVMCIVRCICCGAECACCCFRCCTCCCTPRGSRGSSGHKRMESEQPPQGYPSPYPPPAPMPMDNRPVNQQYRSHAAPTFNPAPMPAPAPAPAPEPERPQFATFDAPKKPVNGDALPAMPMMSDARDRYVEEEVIPEKKGDMEMDRLDHNGSVSSSGITGAAAVGRRSPGRSPVQRSNTQDSYGFPPGYQTQALPNGAPHRSPNHSPAPYGAPYGQQQDGFRNASPVHSSPVYGAGAGYTQNQQYDRVSPAQSLSQYSQPGVANPPNPNGYGYGAPPPSNGMQFNDGYNDNFDSYISNGPTPRSNTPGYNNGYGAPPPPRTTTPGYDSYAPAPARTNTPGYDTYAAAVPRTNTPGYGDRYASPAPRSNTPGYAASGTTAPPAYPGQQTYESPEPAYPGQQTYQTFKPS